MGYSWPEKALTTEFAIKLPLQTWLDEDQNLAKNSCAKWLQRSKPPMNSDTLMLVALCARSSAKLCYNFWIHCERSSDQYGSVAPRYWFKAYAQKNQNKVQARIL